MSGEIFQPMESFEDLDLTKRNPLLCYLCNEQYEDPCILGCFHSYCSRCLRGRASDGKMACPLCSSTTVLKEGISLPPSDRLLKFMVESSLDEKAQCANCDTDHGHMFFCNTCSQPLCLTCRDETHSAKMFAAHDVVLLSKRTKDIHKQCSLHGEPYIMFSSEKKIMLCINCFRDMRIESRAHCVDLETAYNQSCRKLEQSVQTIRDLQNSTREGILLLKALLDEIHVNSEKEREAILLLYDSMQEKITQCKLSLLEEVDNQYRDKETLFKAQLTDLTSLLPTIHVHLVTAAAFSSSANKFEFLDMSYAMMERLKSIVHRQHPLHPCHSSQINTDFKVQFAKSLDHLLFHGRLSASMTTSSSLQRNGNGVTPPPSISRLDLTKLGNQGSKMSPTNTRRASGNVAKIKFIDAKGLFAEHCVEFETSHRDMLQKLEKLKSEVQELQRDLTLRRCLTRKTAIPDLKDSISSIEQQLELHQNTIQQKQPTLEKYWEESVQRMGNEQELYEAQVHDVHRLQQETQHLKLIASQLTSFVSTIASVTERLAPKVGQMTNDGEHDNQMLSLIEEIKAVQPDSQQRVDAIQTCEEVREEKSANRKNPLDEELIKTKGMLKATLTNKHLKDNLCGSPVTDSSVSSKKDNSNVSPVSDTTVLSKKDNSDMSPVSDTMVLSTLDNSKVSDVNDSSVCSKKDNSDMSPVSDAKVDNSKVSDVNDSSVCSKKDNSSISPVNQTTVLSKKDNSDMFPVSDAKSDVNDSSVCSKKDNSSISPVNQTTVLSKKDNSDMFPVSDAKSDVNDSSVCSKKDNSSISPVNQTTVLSKKDNSSISPVNQTTVLSKKDNFSISPVNQTTVLSKKDNASGSPVNDDSLSAKKDKLSGSPVDDSSASSKKDNSCRSPVAGSDNSCGTVTSSGMISKKDNSCRSPIGGSGTLVTSSDVISKKDNSCETLVTSSGVISKKDNSCGTVTSSVISKIDNSCETVTSSDVISKKDNSCEKVTSSGMISKIDNSCETVTSSGVISKKDNSCKTVTSSGVISKKDNSCEKVTSSDVISKKDNTCEKVTSSGVISKKDNSCEKVTSSSMISKKDKSCETVTSSGVISKTDNSCGTLVTTSVISKKNNSSQSLVGKNSVTSKRDKSSRTRVREGVFSKKGNSSSLTVTENCKLSIKTDSTSLLNKDVEDCTDDVLGQVKERETIQKASFPSSSELDTHCSAQENISLIDSDNTILQNKFPSPLNSSLLAPRNECGDVMKNNSSLQEEDQLIQNAHESLSKPQDGDNHLNKKDSNECSGRPSKDGFVLINRAAGDCDISTAGKNASRFPRNDNSAAKKDDCSEENECSVEATVILNIES